MVATVRAASDQLCHHTDGRLVSTAWWTRAASLIAMYASFCFFCSATIRSFSPSFQSERHWPIAAASAGRISRAPAAASIRLCLAASAH